MALFLRLEGGSPDTRVKVIALTFKAFVPTSKTWKSVIDSLEHEFSPGVPWGVRTGIKHADLLAEPSEYLFAGALTIRVDMDFEVSSDFGAYAFRMAQLYESKDLADVTMISSDGKEFEARRSILAAHSAVFRRMFAQDMVEKQTGHVNLEDVDGETLDLLLRYVYSGDRAKVAGNAENLLVAADKYDVSDLRSLTMKLLLANLTFQNALHLMDVAAQRNLPEMSNAIAEFLLDNLEIFRQTAEYHQLKLDDGRLLSFLDVVGNDNRSLKRKRTK